MSSKNKKSSPIKELNANQKLGKELVIFTALAFNLFSQN